MLNIVLKKMSVVLMVVGLSCITLTGCGVDLNATYKKEYAIAQKSVDELLVSPGTAVYEEWSPDMMQAKGYILEDLGEGQELEYFVSSCSGYVDSANENGIMIRNAFVVDIYRYTDERNKSHFDGEGSNVGISDHVYCHVIAFN